MPTYSSTLLRIRAGESVFARRGRRAVFGWNRAAGFLQRFFGALGKRGLLAQHDFSEAEKRAVDAVRLVGHVVDLIQVWCRARQRSRSSSLMGSLGIMAAELVERSGGFANLDHVSCWLPLWPEME